MGELEVKRALAFLSSPQAASWSQTQKVDFLRSKLAPADLEEVIQRMKFTENDLSQFFEEPKQLAPVAPAKVEGYGIYSLIGAGLLGALASALFFSAPEEKKRKKKRDPPPEEVKPEEMKAPPQDKTLDEVKEGQSRLETSLAAIEKRLASLSSREEAPPAPPFDSYTLHRAISTYFNACAPEAKGRALNHLMLWLQKTEASPRDKSAHRINTTTPGYKNEVGAVPGATELMQTLGFTLNGGFWEFSEEKMPALKEGLRILNDEKAKQRASASQASYNPSKPWLFSAQKPPAETKSEAPALPSESIPELASSGLKADPQEATAAHTQVPTGSC